jgi:FixJ family two-component response regulator
MNNSSKPRVPLIIVVDDDASIRLATDSLLRSRGYAVDSFASGEEFLHSGQIRNAACVITDVRMPVMGGVRLQAELRAQGYRVPFIFITAFPEEETRRRALEDGATCFLAKPFAAPQLIGCIEQALGAGHGAPTREV